NYTNSSRGGGPKLEFGSSASTSIALLFLSPDVQTQRHVRQMRVIVLGPRAARKSIEKLAFVVSEILIAEVPIEVTVYLDGHPGFRRLEIIRIRSDKRAPE